MVILLTVWSFLALSLPLPAIALSCVDLCFVSCCLGQVVVVPYGCLVLRQSVVFSSFVFSLLLVSSRLFSCLLVSSRLVSSLLLCSLERSHLIFTQSLRPSLHIGQHFIGWTCSKRASREGELVCCIHLLAYPSLILSYLVVVLSCGYLALWLFSVLSCFVLSCLVLFCIFLSCFVLFRHGMLHLALSG